MTRTLEMAEALWHERDVDQKIRDLQEYGDQCDNYDQLLELTETLIVARDWARRKGGIRTCLFDEGEAVLALSVIERWADNRARTRGYLDKIVNDLLEEGW